ncbi:hypothetical protein VNO78_02997 [Psophocarpus tetragonolobus]|uniref:Non-specific lipid-transfer protein n=1 Tax=Psophocarpus tetragonolobus TaxID=3891 RepID=A0AAN9T3J7_PSOTE
MMQDMNTRKPFVFVIAFILLLSTLGSSQSDDISCTEVVPLLIPCRSYLTGLAEISPDCCTAINSVNQIAITTEIRRKLCGCFESVANLIGVIPERSRQLPQLCNINLSFPFDPSVDCNS